MAVFVLLPVAVHACTSAPVPFLCFIPCLCLYLCSSLCFCASVCGFMCLPSLCAITPIPLLTVCPFRQSVRCPREGPVSPPAMLEDVAKGIDDMFILNLSMPCAASSRPLSATPSIIGDPTFTLFTHLLDSDLPRTHDSTQASPKSFYPAPIFYSTPRPFVGHYCPSCGKLVSLSAYREHVKRHRQKMKALSCPSVSSEGHSGSPELGNHCMKLLNNTDAHVPTPTPALPTTDKARLHQPSPLSDYGSLSPGSHLSDFLSPSSISSCSSPGLSSPLPRGRRSISGESSSSCGSLADPPYPQHLPSPCDLLLPPEVTVQRVVDASPSPGGAMGPSARTGQGRPSLPETTLPPTPHPHPALTSADTPTGDPKLGLLRGLPVAGTLGLQYSHACNAYAGLHDNLPLVAAKVPPKNVEGARTGPCAEAGGAPRVSKGGERFASILEPWPAPNTCLDAAQGESGTSWQQHPDTGDCVQTQQPCSSASVSMAEPGCGGGPQLGGHTHTGVVPAPPPAPDKTELQKPRQVKGKGNSPVMDQLYFTFQNTWEGEGRPVVHSVTISKEEEQQMSRANKTYTVLLSFPEDEMKWSDHFTHECDGLMCGLCSMLWTGLKPEKGCDIPQDMDLDISFSSSTKEVKNEELELDQLKDVKENLVRPEDLMKEEEREDEDEDEELVTLYYNSEVKKDILDLLNIRVTRQLPSELPSDILRRLPSASTSRHSTSHPSRHSSGLCEPRTQQHNQETLTQQHGHGTEWSNPTALTTQPMSQEAMPGSAAAVSTHYLSQATTMQKATGINSRLKITAGRTQHTIQPQESGPPATGKLNSVDGGRAAFKPWPSYPVKEGIKGTAAVTSSSCSSSSYFSSQNPQTTKDSSIPNTNTVVHPPPPHPIPLPIPPTSTLTPSCERVSHLNPPNQPYSTHSLPKSGFLPFTKRLINDSTSLRIKKTASGRVVIAPLLNAGHDLAIPVRNVARESPTQVNSVNRHTAESTASSVNSNMPWNTNTASGLHSVRMRRRNAASSLHSSSMVRGTSTTFNPHSSMTYNRNTASGLHSNMTWNTNTAHGPHSDLVGNRNAAAALHSSNIMMGTDTALNPCSNMTYNRNSASGLHSNMMRGTNTASNPPNNMTCNRNTTPSLHSSMTWNRNTLPTPSNMTATGNTAAFLPHSSTMRARNTASLPHSNIMRITNMTWDTDTSSTLQSTLQGTPNSTAWTTATTHPDHSLFTDDQDSFTDQE